MMLKWFFPKTQLSTKRKNNSNDSFSIGYRKIEEQNDEPEREARWHSQKPQKRGDKETSKDTLDERFSPEPRKSGPEGDLPPHPLSSA